MNSTNTAIRQHVTLDSPYGPLTLVAEDDAVVGLYMDTQRHRPDESLFGGPGDPAASPFAEAAAQLREYFAGDRTDFTVALRPHGTPFQEQVWAALCEIPYGETWSYRELAEHIGRPTATRAVGLANGKNPISIIVPCHRVIGANGSLTGYGGGLDRKRALLAHERAHAAQRPAGGQQALFA